MRPWTSLSVVLLSAALLQQSDAAHAQTQPAAATHADLAGDWQASFTGASDATRVVFRVSKAPAGWRAVALWVEPGHYVASIPSVVVHGDAVSFVATARELNGSFAGTESADGNTLTGKWTHGSSEGNGGGVATQPLTMTRATKVTAWAIAPALGSDAKLIPANLDPTFEVATVKPHDPSVRGGGWRWMGARRFEATMPVGALLADIYGIQRDQIIGLPDWGFKNVYDYVGVPDLPGWPTQDQRYSMERKLLEDRFKLKTHMETRDMSGLLLALAKSGVTMTPSVIVDPGVTFSMRPAPNNAGLTVSAQNSSMGDLKRVLQDMLNQPVVDHTGLKGQYDFDLTCMPDETFFGGHMHLPPRDSSGEAAPEIYQALQQQLGLKLSRYKGPIEVLVIDHIEPPSSN